MLSALARHGIAAKVAYGGACAAAAVVLAVSGEAHGVVSAANSIGKGAAIQGPASPSTPSTQPINILVMGLESRTAFNGTELDHHLQVVLHSGSNGSQDTDTLMLVHIYAGGKKAYGYSIPRDDLVTYPQPYDGQSEGKIDAAYAYAYYGYVNDHYGKESSAALYQNANDAGQLATIATVQAVTGQKVDHFVDLNLIGFYYLAQAFGGLEVCLKPAPASAEPAGMAAGTNLTDQDPLTGTDNSGFDAYTDGYSKAKGGTQYLHLDPAQSLAFIRSRDTLPGIDLGRTHRQQAAIDYVVYELKHEGIFSDFGRLNSLLGVAAKWIQTDPGFKLLDFATDMQALNGQNISFATLPYTPENNVAVPGYSGLQDVNIISIPVIKKLVASTFDPTPAPAKPSAGASKSTKSSAPTPAPATVTVDVYNGNPGANGFASQVSQALAGLGYQPGAIANPSAQSQTVETGTQVFYGAGTSANAAKIAADFGATAQALSSLPAGHVEVLTGSDVSSVPAALASATAGTQSVGAAVIGATAASASPAASPSASASGGSSGTISVAPGAEFGIPCVY
jgi:anionic cell wall polymer biosynthesis LytR-Cps2A-Psr (LCP) family protein